MPARRTVEPTSLWIHLVDLRLLSVMPSGGKWCEKDCVKVSRQCTSVSVARRPDQPISIDALVSDPMPPHASSEKRGGFPSDHLVVPGEHIRSGRSGWKQRGIAQDVWD